jgi:hypothetical protein
LNKLVVLILRGTNLVGVHGPVIGGADQLNPISLGRHSIAGIRHDLFEVPPPIFVAQRCDIAVANFARNLLDGFGFVVPAVEKRRIIAGSMASVKFPGRAPEGKVLLRVFVGGALQPELGELPDDEIRQLVLEELRELIGLSGEPEFCEVIRWLSMMPQYHVGHLDLVAKIEERSAAIPHFALAGNAYRGVGIPFCIRSGEQAAERVMRNAGEVGDQRSAVGACRFTLDLGSALPNLPGNSCMPRAITKPIIERCDFANWSECTDGRKRFEAIWFPVTCGQRLGRGCRAYGWTRHAKRRISRRIFRRQPNRIAAISNGSQESLECLLVKMGVSASEIAAYQTPAEYAARFERYVPIDENPSEPPSDEHPHP